MPTNNTPNRRSFLRLLGLTVAAPAVAPALPTARVLGDITPVPASAPVPAPVTGPAPYWSGISSAVCSSISIQMVRSVIEPDDLGFPRMTARVRFEPGPDGE